MALFRATVKLNVNVNGEKLAKGMSVEFQSSQGSPMTTNGGHEVIDAFKRYFGVDIKKAGALSSSYIEVKKVG